MKKEIEDIFSKSPVLKNKQEQNKIPIIIDTREKQSLVSASLLELGAKIEFEKLDIGDYLINGIVIERKTLNDFQNSIINKRLLSQLGDSRKYSSQLLILEGFNYNYSDLIIHENALRGMILSSSLNFEIPVIFTEDEKDTAKYLLVLAKKQEKELQQVSLRYKKPEMTLEEQKKFILEGFPGIGPTTSESLIKKHKTLKKIFSLKHKQLIQSENFDEKKAENFRKILDS